MNEYVDVQPENSSNRSQTYTAQDIAAILNISVRTAYNLCTNTDNFNVVRIGRCVRANRMSFDRWLAGCNMADD